MEEKKGDKKEEIRHSVDSTKGRGRERGRRGGGGKEERRGREEGREGQGRGGKLFFNNIR